MLFISGTKISNKQLGTFKIMWSTIYRKKANVENH